MKERIKGAPDRCKNALIFSCLALFPASILDRQEILIMKSPLAPLLIGCVVLISPKAVHVHARTAPLYVYRAPPTTTPTFSPSISSQPSLQPSLQHESYYLRSSHKKPSSELLLVICLTSALLLLCVASVVSFLVSKKRNISSPEEEEEEEVKADAEAERKGVGWYTWVSSFWLSEPSWDEPSCAASFDESLG